MSYSPWSKDKDTPRSHEAVTTSDTVNLPDHSVCYTLTAGNVAVVDKNDTLLVYTGLAAGTKVPVIAKRINATGTTATLARVY